MNVQAAYKYTYISENDCSETEQNIMDWDEPTFVKRTLVAVKTSVADVIFNTTDVPESDCDCESEQ